ncbi:methyltransferase domain-containing protein [Streptomyces sp. DSM 41982]|uniref:Methyltransferase domain-containing protein n=1 Tax=Streptomyces evansiae TaxID=3075535 RepID=A0ABD5E0D1_9ACTN|nr:methyltransferase domain-containing protein [Streptomyces sp. DSM 41982]MDT0414800.1 methyltransferase domain-containing protein [Streptomyces sp. DSM 41982]
MTDLFERAVPDPAAYLDRLAATDAARTYKAVILDALDARPGATALDLGCGSGADLGPLADAVGPTGKVVGVELLPGLAERARERTRATAHIGVVAGDLHALPFPDGSADLARTDRGLQHVVAPARALAEIRRVLRPGGRLVMGEPDWDSLAIDHPDLGLARAYTRHVADRIVRNGVIGRQLPRLAREAGFAVRGVVPVTSVFREVEAADRVLGLRRTTERAVAAGGLSAAEAERWLGHLATEPFHAAVTLHVVVAEAAA